MTPDIGAIKAQLVQTTTTWLNALDGYTAEQFAAKPDEENWSIGQVYEHLVGGTNRFFLAKMHEALADTENGDQTPNERGQGLLALGSFPPIKIKGPATNAQPRQPESPEVVKAALTQLIQDLKSIGDEIAAAGSTGKANHPAFGFLSAQEWYNYTDMHFRHHFRQKEALEKWLGGEVYA